MPTGNQSRRAFAPRAADSRTPLEAFISLAEGASALFNKIDRATPHAYPHGQRLRDDGNNLYVTAGLHALNILPQNDADLLLLAAQAAAWSDQLPDLADAGNIFQDRLLSGLSQATAAIADYLARQQGLDHVQAISPELAATTRLQMNAIAALRADAEAPSHG
jgi:hypothetical protein